MPSFVRSFHVRPASQHVAILPSSPVRAIRNRHALKSDFSWVRNRVQPSPCRRSSVVTPASSVVLPGRFFFLQKLIKLFVLVFFFSRHINAELHTMSLFRSTASKLLEINQVRIYLTHLLPIDGHEPPKILVHPTVFVFFFARPVAAFEIRTGNSLRSV